jgi:hypothetical protein
MASVVEFMASRHGIGSRVHGKISSATLSISFSLYIRSPMEHEKSRGIVRGTKTNEPNLLPPNSRAFV